MSTVKIKVSAIIEYNEPFLSGNTNVNDVINKIENNIIECYNDTTNHSVLKTFKIDKNEIEVLDYSK